MSYGVFCERDAKHSCDRFDAVEFIFNDLPVLVSDRLFSSKALKSFDIDGMCLALYRLANRG
jgi:hypothetical protein